MRKTDQPSGRDPGHVDALLQEIRDVFRGVKLGEGVGLFQGQGLDDYATEDEIARLRADDEKEDWQLISTADLNRCYSSLTFFDPAGMRFHLPAFLIAELRGKFEMELLYHLTDLSKYGREQLSALLPAERKVIRKFLEHLLRDEDYEMERAAIRRGLGDYWKE